MHLKKIAPLRLGLPILLSISLLILASCGKENTPQPNPTPTATVPSTPTIGMATAGDKFATITFTASSSDGGAAITSYTAVATPGGLTGTGTGSPITVNGLSNDVTYSFAIYATNSKGNSASSVFSNLVTPIDANKKILLSKVWYTGTLYDVQLPNSSDWIPYIHTIPWKTKYYQNNKFEQYADDGSEKLIGNGTYLVSYQSGKTILYHGGISGVDTNLAARFEVQTLTLTPTPTLIVISKTINIPPWLTKDTFIGKDK